MDSSLRRYQFCWLINIGSFISFSEISILPSTFSYSLSSVSMFSPSSFVVSPGCLLMESFNLRRSANYCCCSAAFFIRFRTNDSFYPLGIFILYNFAMELKLNWLARVCISCGRLAVFYKYTPRFNSLRFLLYIQIQ